MQSTLAFSLIILLARLSALCRAAPQPWPALQHNELESIWLEGGVGIGLPGMNSGFNSMVPFVRNCNPSEGTSTAPAEWIRLAYHDMATHNVNGDGLGGLDQSIRYELDRPENVGESLKRVFFDLGGHPSQFTSMSDTIAISVVHAVAACHGPVIPFRSGRIDSTEAGPAGVPEPHQSLEEHTESFRKQGFNQTEMIELVACGHTVGGVHPEDFPELVENIPDPNGGDTRVNFDTTPDFDNVVVLEYLNGTTPNVLVSHHNTTLLSDLRIFSSDGNQTMQRLADPTVFKKRCRDLFERMINTVPRGVELGEVFEAIDVKVGRTFLTFNTTLGLQTDIRFLTLNPDRVVTLKWKARNDETIFSAAPNSVTENDSEVSLALGHKVVHYWFFPSINSTSSISKFWFEVDEGDERGAKVHDRDGEGYTIEQDTLVLATGKGGFTEDFLNFRVVMAIRKDAGPVSNVTGTFRFVSVFGESAFETHTLALDTSLDSTPEYDFYSTAVPSRGRTLFDITATVGGESVQNTAHRLTDIRQRNPFDTVVVPEDPEAGSDRPGLGDALS